MNDTKQVIVIRRDLNMRRGKEVAQGSHASMSFMTEVIKKDGTFTPSEVQLEWMIKGFRKITCQVQTEQELTDLHNLAKSKGLESHLIVDEGLTEFNGEYTITALAIGPDRAFKIDEVTKNLKLY